MDIDRSRASMKNPDGNTSSIFGREMRKKFIALKVATRGIVEQYILKSRNYHAPISFPVEEWVSIRERLLSYGDVFTTRVGGEVQNFSIRKKFITPWGDNLIVSDIQYFDDIEKHPYYGFLSPEQRNVITKNMDRYYIVVKLQLISH